MAVAMSMGRRATIRTSRTASQILSRLPTFDRRLGTGSMRHHRFGFECASCGIIRLEIPKDAQDATLIRCTQCHTILGHGVKSRISSS